MRPYQVWGKLTSSTRLGLTDQERQTASRGDEADSHRKGGIEAFHGAEGDDGSSALEILGAPGEYIDVCQC